MLFPTSVTGFWTFFENYPKIGLGHVKILICDLCSRCVIVTKGCVSVTVTIDDLIIFVWIFGASRWHWVCHRLATKLPTVTQKVGLVFLQFLSF